jgi:hypothetical protein
MKITNVFRRIIIIVFSTCFSFSVFAHKDLEISGGVIDEDSRDPLYGVSISLQYSLLGTITNKDGSFSINVPDSSSVLIFSMIGYETREFTIKQLRKQKFNVKLKVNPSQLKEVIITDSKTQPVVESKLFFVMDYAIINDGIIVLTFRQKLSDAKLVLTDITGNVISSINVPEIPEKLFKDCLGNVHLLCKNKAYEVYFDPDRKSIQYLPSVSRDYFEAIVFPCMASMSGNLYFKEGTVYSIIYTFQNRKMERPQFLTSASWSRTKFRMLRPGDLVQKKNSDDLVFDELKPGTEPLFGMKDNEGALARNVIFTPVFAPLFKINHTIYVFNHPDSIIESFDVKGNKLTEVKINYHDYHKKKGWKEKIFVDEKLNKVYTIYMESPVGATMELSEINLSNGIIQSSYTIPYTFPENVQVFNGYAYFICKGNNAWDDTKYLYRMRLE